MFNTMTRAVEYFSTIGLFLQDDLFVPCYRYPSFIVKRCGFFMTMLIIMCVFSVIASTIAFFSYRVFKAKALGLLAGAPP